MNGPMDYFVRVLTEEEIAAKEAAHRERARKAQHQQAIANNTAIYHRRLLARGLTLKEW
jgi:hypothetical protein